MGKVFAAFASVSAVFTFSMGGIHALESQLLRLIPNIHTPNISGLPTKTGTIAKEGSAVKTFAGGLGRAIPFVAGYYAGDQIADYVGDSLPGSTGIIKQNGRHYTEDINGIHYTD